MRDRRLSPWGPVESKRVVAHPSQTLGLAGPAASGLAEAALTTPTLGTPGRTPALDATRRDPRPLQRCQVTPETYRRFGGRSLFGQVALPGLTQSYSALTSPRGTIQADRLRSAFSAIDRRRSSIISSIAGSFRAGDPEPLPADIEGANRCPSTAEC